MTPAESTIRRFESAAGQGLVVAAAALLLLPLVFPATPPGSPSPTDLSSPEEAAASAPGAMLPSPERGPLAMGVLLLLGVAGLGILTPHLIGTRSLPEWLSRPPDPPPGWTLWDAVKPVALFICTLVTIQALVKPSKAGPLLISQAIAEGGAVLYCLALVRWKGGGFHRLRMGAGAVLRLIRPGLKSYLAFLPLFYAAFLLNLGLYWGYATLAGRPFPPEPGAVEGLFRELRDAPVSLAVLAVSAVIAVPFAEELYFRGLLQGGLRRHLTRTKAASVAGVLFGLVHLDPLRVLPLALFGIYLGWLRERSGGLALPMLVHAWNNLLMVALMILLLA